MSSSQFRRGKRRFDDDESTFLKRDRHRRRLPPADFGAETFGLPGGDRWSTWDQSAPTERGPRPHPDWLVTDLAAVDTELGILKTGKEADVFLLRRGVPGAGRSCLLAAKRYRAAEHRMFQRDSEYLEGRRVRESRVNRAIAARSAAGRAMISTQWASAEFARPQPAVRGRPAGALSGAATQHRAAAGVSSASRTVRPRRSWPRSGRPEPSSPACGTSW